MNNLKNRILALLISCFSVFLVVLFIIFNVNIYNKEYQKLENRLIRLSNNHKRIDFDYQSKVNPILIDNDIYVVLVDKNGNIINYLNYSTDNIDKDTLQSIIDNYQKKYKNNIATLYFSDYIVHSSSKNNIFVINNKNTKSYLLNVLLELIILFIILEAIFIYFSIIITKWIIKPVNEAFLKQKQFISDASHELKTPISIIQASAEMLDKKTDDNKFLNNIKEETKRMDILISNLLELSRIEGNKNSNLYKEINLSKLIKNKALTFEALMFENNLVLDTNINDNIMFYCDSNKILELLSILVDNAICHGDINSKITINLYEEKSSIILSVKNKGEEIPIDERKKIFARFYRGSLSRNRDENRYGLGLSIALSIVNNHNGNINVYCENGYTTFLVKFKI